MTYCHRLTLLVLLVYCVIPHAFSIKCWNCQSSYDPMCADPFDNSTIPITDCSQEKGSPSMCRKIRQKVNGGWNYVRDCAYLGEVSIRGDERFCQMRTGTDNILTEYCTCNSKDGCNSSYLFMPKPALLVTLFIFPWIVLKV